MKIFSLAFMIEHFDMGAAFSVLVRWGWGLIGAAAWLIVTTATSAFEDKPKRGEFIWSTAGAIFFGIYTAQALVEKPGPVAAFLAFLTLVCAGLALYFAFKE